MSKKQADLSAQSIQAYGYKTILDLLDTCIYIKDVQGRYVYVNPVVAKLFDSTPDAVIGHDDHQFFELHAAERIQSVDRQAIDEGMPVVREEIDTFKSTGETIIYLSSKAPIRNHDNEIIGVCGISVDITIRKNLEEKLIKQQTLLETILDNIDSYAYIKDRNRRFVYVNNRFAHLLGKPIKEIVGSTDSEVFPVEIANQHWKLDQNVFETGVKLEVEESFPGIDGEIRHFWSVKIPIQLPDKRDAILGFSTDITKILQLNRELQHLALTDELTGLGNRRYFFDVAEKMFAQAVRYQQPLSVIMLDLDFFKKINDTYGHKVGDEVLVFTAQIFKDSIRSCDTIGRLGGEEFAILLPNTSQEQALILAERIQQALHHSKIQSSEGYVLSPTVSMGVASLGSEVQKFSELLTYADKALYQAKISGRDCVRCHR